ncbi:AraC family transcriptional regulator [Roseibium algae]|uniref:AraC family transcriptional regulator n=1 Tax=Roseibium algae TaxID=3123038 RepID=A0ABU8TK66_9HYPH
MKHTNWAAERNQFEHRMSAREVEPSELFSNRDGSTLLAVSTLDAMEGEFEASPYLILAMSLGRAGRFLRSGDWGKIDGVFSPGSIALALPGAKAEGYQPKARLLGILMNPKVAQTILADNGGLNALQPATTSLLNDDLIESVMIALWRDADAHGLSSAFFDHGLELILRKLTSFDQPKSPARPVRSLSQQQLQKALELIESRIGQDLRVDEIASALGQDVRSVTRAFRATTGYAPFEYLTFRRMERAKELLNTKATIMSIALDVGYANPAKFAAAFRRFHSCPPSEWRKQQR